MCVKMPRSLKVTSRKNPLLIRYLSAVSPPYRKSQFVRIWLGAGYSTINEAIDAVGNVTDKVPVIRVGPGTYKERLVVERPVVIEAFPMVRLSPPRSSRKIHHPFEHLTRR